MNRLTARQRKLIYGAGIVLLTIPIIWLGRPATRDDAGGALAKMRARHKLGEASLGEIDPSSATMNLVLLGLRGIATDLLWMQADEQKRTKNWAPLKATVNSITLLQPHYVKVWDFQSWNLAYNVSAEWDGVEDRYYWVKEGAKFLTKGIERNKDVPKLPHWQARIIGQKIGIADEWRYYRRFFKHDPDPSVPEYPGGPDPELNPLGRDNYLVAKDLYREANEKEATNHVPSRALFRSQWAHSQIEYAMMLQREGVFEEAVQKGPWEVAYRDWTEGFGQETFATPIYYGDKVYTVGLRMDPSEEEIAAIAREHELPVEVVRRTVRQSQSIVNYQYWKQRADAERRGETEEAHRKFYEAHRLVFEENELDRAQQLVEEALEQYSFAYNTYFQGIQTDRSAVEEGLRGLLLWEYIHKLQGKPMPSIEERFGPTINNLWNRYQVDLPDLRRQMIGRAEE